MTGSWKILLGSWKSPGNYSGQDSGNPERRRHHSHSSIGNTLPSQGSISPPLTSQLMSRWLLMLQ